MHQIRVILLSFLLSYLEKRFCNVNDKDIPLLWREDDNKIVSNWNQYLNAIIAFNAAGIMVVWSW